MEKLEKNIVTYVFLNNHTRIVKDGLVEQVQELILSGKLDIRIDGEYISIGNDKFRYSIKSSLIDVIQVQEY